MCKWDGDLHIVPFTEEILCFLMRNQFIILLNLTQPCDWPRSESFSVFQAYYDGPNTENIKGLFLYSTFQKSIPTPHITVKIVEQFYVRYGGALARSNREREKGIN